MAFQNLEYVESADQETLGYPSWYTCKVCHLRLPIESFHVSGNVPHGTKCKLCRSLIKYGLTRLTYEAQLTRQGNVCMLCKSANPGKNTRWHVDHDHACCPDTPTCGSCNRSLLCAMCNQMLGFARDDVDLLRHAAMYLETGTYFLPRLLGGPKCCYASYP